MKNENIFMPVIKWSGSKRYQAPLIVAEFPQEIDTYYEPFCGSCAVMKYLMASPFHNVKNFVCSDINQDLINIWNNVKNNPALTLAEYTYRWYELNKDDDNKRRHEYYYKVRDRFNENHDADDFLFIMRTCFNGLVRYNSENKFNSSFHFSRKGIRPERF
jgi:DNA adenine methylase